jgi:hypothetical protein
MPAGQGPGIAEQLRELMRERGYWLESKDRPAAMRFAEERGYELMLVLKWLDGVQPSWDNLYRLARDLRVTPARLLFGADEGERLVTSMAPSAAKKSRGKRGRGAKAIGVVALFAGSLVAPGVAAPTGECGHTDKAPLCKLRGRRRAEQLALDLAAA